MKDKADDELKKSVLRSRYLSDENTWFPTEEKSEDWSSSGPHEDKIIKSVDRNVFSETRVFGVAHIKGNK